MSVASTTGSDDDEADAGKQQREAMLVADYSDEEDAFPSAFPVAAEATVASGSWQERVAFYTSTEFLSQCGIYTAHAAYVTLVLVGWTIWRPLVVLIPVTGVTWEMARGCPLSHLEMWLFQETPFGHPSWRVRVLLWLIMLVYLIVGWTLA